MSATAARNAIAVVGIDQFRSQTEDAAKHPTSANGMVRPCSCPASD